MNNSAGGRGRPPDPNIDDTVGVKLTKVRQIIDSKELNPNKRARTGGLSYTMSANTTELLQNLKDNRANVEQYEAAIQELEVLMDEAIGMSQEDKTIIYRDMFKEILDFKQKEATKTNTSVADKNLLPKTYNYTDAGPFIVIVNSKEQNITGLHPMALGKMLKDAKIQGIKNINEEIII